MRKEALRLFKDVKPGVKEEAAEGGDLPSLHAILFDIFDEFTSVVTARSFWKKLLAISGDPTLLASVSTKLGSTLLDVLAVQATEAEESSDTTRHTFMKELLQSGWKEALVKDTDIVARFSTSSASTILNVAEANLSRSYRVSISKHFFTLPEFNLLREEGEGYSKLISYLLSTDLAQQGNNIAPTINSMLGAFALHPNRVLDLVLSAAGFHLDLFFDSPIRSRTFDAYCRSITPILNYLRTPPASHIYSLLSFHLKPSGGSKDTAEKKSTATDAKDDDKTSKETQTTSKGLSLSVCRILAMLLRFKVLDWTAVETLITPPAASSDEAAKTSENDTRDNKEKKEDGEDADDIIIPPVEETPDEIFLKSPSLQLLAAVLEIPDTQPLAFLEPTSEFYEQFQSLMSPKLFGVKRMASVFASRIESFFTPIYAALSVPTSLFASKRPSIPTFEAIGSALLHTLPLILNMGESISSRLHNVICVVSSSLIAGILESGKINEAPISSSRNAKATVTTCVPADMEKVSQDFMSRVYSAIEELIEKVLLPSYPCLSISADSLWNLLQLWPFTTRYRWYHAWTRMGTQRAYPVLKSVVSEARTRVRAMMKRMTDVSLKETGRPLCKNLNLVPPGVVDLIGSLAFPNFVQPLAESMRYLYDLTLDILVYACLDAGMNMCTSAAPNAHFFNIASFIASVFKLYYERLDIEPLMEVIEMLMRGSNIAGASIFTTLLSKMGCVDILEETLSSQLRMVHSFPALNKLAISGALQSKETSRSSIFPLRDRLWFSNSWLPLSILILQLQDQYAYHGEFKDIGRTSQSYDTVHQLFLQLAEFTSHIFRRHSSQITPSFLKSAGQIAKEYNISVAEILHLFRPILHLIYADVAELLGNSSPMIEQAQNQDAEPSSASAMKGSSSLQNSSSTPASLHASRSTEHGSNSLNRPGEHLLSLSKDLEFTRRDNGKSICIFPLNAQLRAALDAMSPPLDPDDEYSIFSTKFDAMDGIFPLGSSFLAAFWGLRLIDVECNAALYKEAIDKQTQSQSQGAGHSVTIKPSNERSVAHISASTIEKELNAHIEHVAAVFERLKALSSSQDWFIDLELQLGQNQSSMDVDGGNNAPKFSEAQYSDLAEALSGLSDTEKKRVVATAFLQHCILPRAVISAEDALFCGAFIRTLHRLNPSPLWDTDIFLDEFFSIMPLILSSTSTNEVSRYGRLVCCVLEMVVSWRDFDKWSADLGGREIVVPEETGTEATESDLQAEETKQGNENEMDADSKVKAEVEDEDVTIKSETQDGFEMQVDEPTPKDAVADKVDSQNSKEAVSEPSTTMKLTPLQKAHQQICVKTLKWECEVVNHIAKGVKDNRDRWMQRATLFFLKEVNSIFPSCERFCELVSYTMKQFAASGGTEDVKALLNSYLNLLESRQRSIGPHDKFACLYPTYEFPDAPPAFTRPTMSSAIPDKFTQSVASPSDSPRRPSGRPDTPSVTMTSSDAVGDAVEDEKSSVSSSSAPRGRGATQASLTQPSSSLSTTSSSSGSLNKPKTATAPPKYQELANSSSSAPASTTLPRTDSGGAKKTSVSVSGGSIGRDEGGRDSREGGNGGGMQDFRVRGGRDFRGTHGSSRDFRDDRFRDRDRDRRDWAPRGNDRGPLERGNERGNERGPDRGPERGPDRGPDRPSERGPDRGMERVPDRGPDHRGGHDRGNESRNERGPDFRGPDHRNGPDHRDYRGPDSRGSDHRGPDHRDMRGPDRNMDRHSMHPGDRSPPHNGPRDGPRDGPMDDRSTKKRTRAGEPDPPAPAAEKRPKLAEPSSSNNKSDPPPRDEGPLPPPPSFRGRRGRR